MRRSIFGCVVIFIAFIIAAFVPLKATTGAPATQYHPSGGGTGVNINCNGGITGANVGDLVVIEAFEQNTTVTVSTNPSDSNGNAWTLTPHSPFRGSNNSIFIFYDILTHNNTGQTVVGTWNASTTGDTDCQVYPGMGSNTVLDCDNTGNSGSGTALSSGSCTTTGTKDLLIGYGGIMLNSITMTSGGSFTMRATVPHSSQGNSTAVEDLNVSSAGSQSASMTSGSSGTWSMMMVAFKRANGSIRQ